MNRRGLEAAAGFAKSRARPPSHFPILDRSALLVSEIVVDLGVITYLSQLRDD
jgi:hypothetical protein